MAVWAYACHECAGTARQWFVDKLWTDQLPATTVRLHVQFEGQWHCAVVNRDRPVEIEGHLVRRAEAAEPGDCQECEHLTSEDQESAVGPPDEPPAAAPAAQPAHRSLPEVLAAAISIQGQQLVVVLAPASLVDSPGEAQMYSADLSARFGGAPIVLLGQYEDGGATWHGDASLIALVRDLPVDTMPWKPYT